MQQLRSDACDELLLDACADNHLIWAERQSEVFGGAILYRPDDTGVHTVSIGDSRPHVLAALVDEPTPATGACLSHLVDVAAGSQASALSVWAVRDRHASVAEQWVGPRGGRRGGQPHWMVLDCHAYRLDETPSPGEASFTVPDSFGELIEPELHCYNPDISAAWRRMPELRPQRVWHAIQWKEGSPVGQVSIHLTEGDLGVVGLHDAVFVRSARVHGPRLDRFDFFVRFALGLTARYIVINAASHTSSFYRALGFRSLGLGQTWWFSCDALQANPSEAEMAFGSAVATGDFTGVAPGDRDVDHPLTNGSTPLEYAAELGRSDSADWLLRQGARPDLLAFWDLGRRDAMTELLETEPGALHQRGRRSGKSLLHRAVERGDVELARFLLSAGADVGALDDEFGATPLTWALELRQLRVAALLRKAGLTT